MKQVEIEKVNFNRLVGLALALAAISMIGLQFAPTIVKVQEQVVFPFSMLQLVFILGLCLFWLFVGMGITVHYFVQYTDYSKNLEEYFRDEEE